MKTYLLCLVIVGLLTGSSMAEPKSAQELFQANCQACHGVQGKGDGPAAAVLQVRPRNLTQRPYRFGCGPGAVASTIKSGIAESGMPSFKDTLTDQEVWTLANYVRSLQGGCCKD